MLFLNIHPLFHSRENGNLMKRLKKLDSWFHRNDDLPSFGRNSKISPYEDFEV